MERFPSGQREQTVNLLSVTSVVRIHPSPPTKMHIARCAFLFVYRVDLGCFLQKTANTLCVSNHLSVLTLGLFAQVQPCAIKRIHPSPPRKSVSFGTDFPFAKSFAFRQNFLGTTAQPIFCYQFKHGKKLQPQFRKIVCLVRLTACFFVYVSGGFRLFSSKKQPTRFACRTTFRC